MVLENDNLNLNGRLMIKCAEIDAGESRETLISIEYFKQWNVRNFKICKMIMLVIKVSHYHDCQVDQL